MRNARVVVVDDSEEFLSVVRELLDESGYEVTTHHGEGLTADALAAMEPDVVILDLVLRGRSMTEQPPTGWDFFLLLRSHPSLSTVPVVICSADAIELRRRESDLERAGNTFILAKPFTIDALEEVVHTALNGEQRQVV